MSRLQHLYGHTIYRERGTYCVTYIGADGYPRTVGGFTSHREAMTYVEQESGNSPVRSVTMSYPKRIAS